MAIATELNINTTATAADMAQAIFGSGIQVVSATFTGDAAASGIYSGALTTLAGMVPSDTGVILSTGNVTDFTNSSGTTDTNVNAATGVDLANGVDGDAQLNAVSGQATYDGAIFTADFIPTGDMLTMQFVFSSEEYPEYVNGGVNDSFGVWVNGQFVEATISVAGNISIDSVNAGSNQNLYRDNTADQFNTEMDGFTYVLSFKAPVNVGEVNSIKIGIADGGDAIYDSNLLIMGDSIQTYALAMDDTVQLAANSSRTFDILANDRDLSGSGLTITHLNGTAVVAGETVTLATGEQVRLNADGTVTVFSDGDLGTNTLNYSIVDGEGNSDVGYIFINTVAAAGPDGIVQGTAGADVIDTSYLGDPDGDRIDNNDGLGIAGTTGDADYVMAGAGNDSVVASIGNDVIYGGTGDDTVFGGAGDDWADLGDGNDSYGTYGADSAGNDTVYGGTGNDSIIGGAADDVLHGGTGRDTLSGGVGNDTVYGGADADQFDISDDHQGDTLLGGETTAAGGSDNDLIAFGNFVGSEGVNVTFTGAEAGTYGYTGTASGTTGSFSEIEAISGTANADQINAAANTADATYSGNAGNDSIVGGSGNETIYGGTGNDTVVAGAGNDLVFLQDGDDSLGGWSEDDSGNDQLFGGNGNDTINAGSGNDLVQGDVGNDQLIGSAGDDVLIGGDGNDRLFGGTGNDISYGGAGNDTLQVVDSDQGETLFGGTETDHVQFSSYSSSAGVNVTFTGAGAGNFAYVATPGAGSFSEIESFGLTEYNDSFDATASTSGITIGAGGGNDVIRGGAAADSLSGDADSDTIYGGAGDTVVGGETTTTGTDNDTLVLNWADVQSIAYGGGGNEAGTVTFYGGGTLAFSEIENIAYAGPVDGLASGELMGAGYTDLNGDQVDGADGNNDTIFGNGGDDTINAGSGDDLAYGGTGNDVIRAQTGNDTLYGDAGNDDLQSGTGNDVMYGGDGADLIHVFATSGADTVVGGEGNDPGFGDILNVNVDAVDTVVTFTGNEAGNAVAGATTVTFSEIETIWTDAGNDTINASAATSDTNIMSGAGNDFVTGSAGNDYINAQAGNDEVFAGAGNDNVYGEAGVDNLYGGDGNDQLYGGTENDYIQGDAGNDLVDGGTGDDFLRGDAGNDLVYGGAGNDSVYGGADSDTVYGDDGNDQVFGGFGEDTVYGGLGDDTVTGSGGNDVVHGDDGNDLLQGSDGDDIFYGGAGADTILGEEDADSFHAGSNDYVDGGEAVTTGADNDTLYVTGIDHIDWDVLNTENGVVHYGDGSTVQFFNIERVFVDGAQVFPPDFIVEGTGGADLIDASYAGDPEGDMIDAADNVAGNNDDVVQAGAGNDTVLAGTGNDIVYGDLGDDSIDGDFGNDTLYGGDGNDILTNLQGTDQQYGGAGNDTMGGVFGDDSYYGGTGDDYLHDGGGSNTVDMGSGNDTVLTDWGNDTIYGGDGNDSLYGGSNDDLIYGGADDDYVSGEEGNDTLYGDAGNDNLSGGDGNDLLDLGDGTDVASGGAGNDTIYGGAGNDVLWGDAGANSLYGGDGLDVLTAYGATDGNLLSGGNDNDTLYGADFNDTLYGGAGNDLLAGILGNNQGDDSLSGELGDDTLLAGDGNDTLSGGAGNDSMLGEGGDDVFAMSTSFGADTIIGGETGETNGDTLDLTKVTGSLTLDLTASNPEAGSVTHNGATAVFSEIENIALGDATETIVLADGSGADVVSGFELPTNMGGGIYVGVDQLDVSGLTDAMGNPVNTDDVTIGSDGNGNAVLTFPNGESLTLVGVNPSQVAGDAILVAMGIPAVVPDYIVQGSAGDDLIDVTYADDLEGDMIDAADNQVANNDDVVTASTGNDSVYSGDGNDSVLGETGNDLIYAGTGNDTVFGGDGNDYAEGGAGDDILSGDVGSDTAYGGLGDDQLQGLSGNDWLDGGEGDDTIYGGSGNDTLTNGSGSDSLYGGADVDLFNVAVNAGDSTVQGGETGTDNDTLNLVSSTNAVELVFTGNEAGTATNGAATVEVLSFSEIENFVLTSQNDLFDASATTTGTTVQSGDGNDTLIGGSGNDNLTGDAGNDVFIAGAGTDTIFGGAGDDTVVLTDGFGNDDLMGGETGETTGDVLDASGVTLDLVLDLSDNEFGPVQEDGALIAGGNLLGFIGFEQIILGSGNDSVIGSTGDDVVTTGAGQDTLDGGAGNDSFNLTTDGEQDLIRFGDGDGNDTLTGFESPADNGDGTFTGHDLLDVSGMTDAGGNPVNTDDVTVTDDGNGNAVLSFPNGETITLIGVPVSAVSSTDQLAALGIPYAPTLVVDGTTGDDVMGIGFTDVHGDQIDGADGDDDTIMGYGGNDTITAGAGNDLVDGGDDNDSLDGGAGDDTLYGDFGNDALHGMAGNDQLLGGEGDDSLFGWDGNDSLDGGTGNDIVDGDLGDDLIYAGEGDDTLVGDEGNDTLSGDDGNDALYAGANADVLDGGIGDDLLEGSAGNDSLTGGDGADTMSGGDDRDSLFGGIGDVVDGGEGGDDYDVLDLTAWGHPATNIIYDVNNPENGTVEFLDGNGDVVGTMTFTNIESVVACFTPGSMILTDEGEVPVEDLLPGDRVLTRDSGYQTIRWTGRRDLSAAELAVEPRFNPVFIAAGALGSGLPVRDMLVSPQHRMLISGPKAELLFGEHEVLVAAKHLVGLAGIEQRVTKAISYIHILFDQHEIVRADGAWSESFQPGAQTLDGMAEESRAEILALFPELAEDLGAFPAARLTLKAREARVLMGA